MHKTLHEAHTRPGIEMENLPTEREIETQCNYPLDGPLEARGRLGMDSPVATAPRVARPHNNY
jgi:hypothetical protein